MPWIYRPNDPRSNDNGMIDRALVEHTSSEAPHVIRDEMEETRHMADNQLYTSKAKFREATKAHGCVEVGNETATMLKPKVPVPLDRQKRRDDIQRAIWQLRNGYKPFG